MTIHDDFYIISAFDQIFAITGLFVGYADDTLKRQGYFVSRNIHGPFLSTWTFSSSLSRHIERVHYLKEDEIDQLVDFLRE